MKIRLLALVMTLAVGTSTPSVAHEAVAVFRCLTTLNFATGSGSTSCNGVATGSHGSLVQGSPISITFNYSILCPVLLISMAGTVDLDGTYFADFTYSSDFFVLTGGHTGFGTMHPVYMPGPNICRDASVGISYEGWFTAV